MEAQFDHILRKCRAAMKLVEDRQLLDGAQWELLLCAGTVLGRARILATSGGLWAEINAIDLERLTAAHQIVVAELRRRDGPEFVPTVIAAEV